MLGIKLKLVMDRFLIIYLFKDLDVRQSQRTLSIFFKKDICESFCSIINQAMRKIII